MRVPCLILAFCALPAAAEIIDRVAVSAGLEVVTGSAIRRQLRLDAFFENSQPNLSPASQRDAARRLLDQLMIRREIELSRFNPVPVADVNKQIAAIRAERKQDEKAFAASLRAAGLSDQDLFDYVQWQISLARFIDFRFRPGVQVGDDEIKVYYDGEFRDLLSKKLGPGAVPPPLNTVRDQIAEVLTNRKIDAAMDQWLDQTRQQAKIRWREEAFR